MNLDTLDPVNMPAHPLSDLLAQRPDLADLALAPRVQLTASAA